MFHKLHETVLLIDSYTPWTSLQNVSSELYCGFL